MNMAKTSRNSDGPTNFLTVSNNHSNWRKQNLMQKAQNTLLDIHEMAKKKAKKFERGPTPDEKQKPKSRNMNSTGVIADGVTSATHDDKKTLHLKVNPYSQIRNSENFKFQTIPDSPGSVNLELRD